MIRPLLLASVWVMTTSSWALTLEESVAHAIDYDPKIAGQYAKFQSVLRQETGARAGFLPQVDLYAAAGYEETYYNNGVRIPSGERDQDRNELGLRASQLLFDGMRTSAEASRLSHEAESERLLLLAESENVALEVVRTYLNLIKTQQLLELSERNVREHQEIYNDIFNRSKTGLSSNSDLAQVAARVATAKSSLIASTNNLYDLQTQFMRLVGQLPRDLTMPAFDGRLIPSSKEVAIQQGLASHPEILSAAEDIKAANEETRRERGNYYPELKLEFQANRNENVGGIEGHDRDARLMLTMSYDIFTGGRTTANIEAAAWRSEEALNTRTRAQREVIEGSTLAWNAFTLLKQQQELLKINVDSAKAAEFGYIEQFNVGRRSLLDVLDAKVEVFLARRNYIETKFERNLAAYRLLNAMGRLTYALRVEHPDQWQEAADQ